MSEGNGVSFSADQVAAAANALRRAAGLRPEEFPEAQVVGMLSDEIRHLRERGVGDEEIAKIVASAGVPIDAATIATSYIDTSQIRRDR